MKDAAKKGDEDVCRTLAKEVIRSRKAITRIHTSKAHLNSVQYQMKAQLGKYLSTDNKTKLMTLFVALLCQ